MATSLLETQERAAAVLHAAQPLDSEDGLRVFGIHGVLAALLWKGLSLEYGGTATPSLRIAQIMVHASEAQALLFLYEAASSDGEGLRRDDLHHLCDAHTAAAQTATGQREAGAVLHALAERAFESDGLFEGSSSVGVLPRPPRRPGRAAAACLALDGCFDDSLSENSMRSLGADESELRRSHGSLHELLEDDDEDEELERDDAKPALLAQQEDGEAADQAVEVAEGDAAHEEAAILRTEDEDSARVAATAQPQLALLPAGGGSSLTVVITFTRAVSPMAVAAAARTAAAATAEREAAAEVAAAAAEVAAAEAEEEAAIEAAAAEVEEGVVVETPPSPKRRDGGRGGKEVEGTGEDPPAECAWRSPERSTDEGDSEDSDWAFEDGELSPADELKRRAGELTVELTARSKIAMRAVGREISNISAGAKEWTSKYGPRGRGSGAGSSGSGAAASEDARLDEGEASSAGELASARPRAGRLQLAEFCAWAEVARREASVSIPAPFVAVIRECLVGADLELVSARAAMLHSSEAPPHPLWSPLAAAPAAAPAAFGAPPAAAPPPRASFSFGGGGAGRPFPSTAAAHGQHRKESWARRVSSAAKEAARGMHSAAQSRAQRAAAPSSSSAVALTAAPSAALAAVPAAAPAAVASADSPETAQDSADQDTQQAAGIPCLSLEEVVAQSLAQPAVAQTTAAATNPAPPDAEEASAPPPPILPPPAPPALPAPPAPLPPPPAPSAVEEEIWENQRWAPLSGFSPSNLLAAERAPFSSDRGDRGSRGLEALESAAPSLLPDGWCWATEWQVDPLRAAEGGDGWAYAAAWGRQATWKAERTSLCLVRRRRWVRVRVPHGVLEEARPEARPKLMVKPRSSLGVC